MNYEFSMSDRVDDLEGRLKNVKSRCAELERQNAAMREAIEVAIKQCFDCGGTGARNTDRHKGMLIAVPCQYCAHLRAAIQPDAGRDFIPKDQVQQAIDKARHAFAESDSNAFVLVAKMLQPLEELL